MDGGTGRRRNNIYNLHVQSRVVVGDRDELVDQQGNKLSQPWAKEDEPVMNGLL